MEELYRNESIHSIPILESKLKVFIITVVDKIYKKKLKHIDCVLWTHTIRRLQTRLTN